MRQIEDPDYVSMSEVWKEHKLFKEQPATQEIATRKRPQEETEEASRASSRLFEKQ